MRTPDAEAWMADVLGPGEGAEAVSWLARAYAVVLAADLANGIPAPFAEIRARAIAAAVWRWNRVTGDRLDRTTEVLQGTTATEQRRREFLLADDRNRLYGAYQRQLAQAGELWTALDQLLGERTVPTPGLPEIRPPLEVVHGGR